jgi:hypothetical protein
MTFADGAAFDQPEPVEAFVECGQHEGSVTRGHPPALAAARA